MNPTAVHQDERTVLADGSTIPTANPSTGVPTQLANPTRTTVRTIVQAIVTNLVVLVPLVNGTLIALNGFLLEQTDLAVPAWVFVIVNVGIAVTSFLIGLAARLMAVPGFAEFIRTRIPWLAPIKPLN